MIVDEKFFWVKCGTGRRTGAIENWLGHIPWNRLREPISVAGPALRVRPPPRGRWFCAILCNQDDAGTVLVFSEFVHELSWRSC